MEHFDDQNVQLCTCLLYEQYSRWKAKRQKQKQICPAQSEIDNAWELVQYMDHTISQSMGVIPLFLTQNVTDACRWALRSYAVKSDRSLTFSVKNSAERYFKIPHIWFRVGPSSLFIFILKFKNLISIFYLINFSLFKFFN